MSGEKNIARTTQLTYRANKAYRAYEAYRAYGPYGAMRLMSLMGRMGRMGRLLLCFIMFNVQCSMFNVSAQIRVGGNVYGAGNQAEVKGNSTVTVYSGTVTNVFGGARMANVGGRTFVNIDANNGKDDGNDTIMISSVYGGNDIAGTIGQSGEETTVPSELENVLDVGAGETKADHPKKNAIDNTWKTFVRTVRGVKAENAEKKWIVIGSMYGGGNGEYDYEADTEAGQYNIYKWNHKYTDQPIATNTTGFTRPVVAKTYLEIKGGEIAHVYGGGNNATITENTTINIDNQSNTCDGYVKAQAAKLWGADPANDGASIDLTATDEHSFMHYYYAIVDSLKSMSKLQTFQSSITSFAFNHARVFGGNNRAEMSIRPTWNLQQGVIRDLFSGGNKGNMTSPEGLLLEINPDVTNNDSVLSVFNVYGGCRMADVKPTVNGEYKPCTNLQDKDGSGNLIYKFPDELSARTLIRGGKITNVYGGNDIQGKVWGGNAIGVYTTIEGDVYGGGNGAYAYTDNESLKDNDVYSDFYYGDAMEGYATSYDALNAFRPNAEQVSIRLKGNGPGASSTIIKGAVYCGGNCASLDTQKDEPMVELKMGSHVVADNVFMGNNGTKMVDPDILRLYASNVDNEGNIAGSGEGSEYSSLDLTDPSVFAGYMDGVVMPLQPDIVFDAVANGDPADYEDRSSYIGSLYCGGNVGSMAIPGLNAYKITRKLNIFEKFVGGCNNADVEAQDGLCAAYEGGVLGSSSERDNYVDGSGNIKDRLRIDLENLSIVPLRWNEGKTQLIWNTAKMGTVYTQVEEGSDLVEGQKYYTSDTGAGEFTAGASATANASTYEKGEDFVEVNRDPDDDDIRLLGGNMYGGCYNSGHVNGNIVININEDVLERENVFENGTSFNGQPASGVKLLNQRDDLDAVALILFGGGYGKETEVWGSVTVNHNKGYIFQICGGGEKGVVGKKHEVLDESGHVTDYAYDFDPKYSTTVNLQGSVTAAANTGHVDDLAETEYIYGGGKEGKVCGNTLVNLGNGRIYDAFAGACEADILGHAEAYIGRQPNGSGGYKTGVPWVQDIVYGGNDYSGTIHGAYEDGYDFEARIKDYNATKAAQLHGNPSNANPGLLKSASYVEYLVGHVDSIYGGNYGYYPYEEWEALDKMPFLRNSFVNIRPQDHARNHITAVFGGGTGFPATRKGDKSQNQSYVLIDLPDDTDKFASTQVFGSGSYNGLGMGFNVDDTMEDSFNPDSLSAIIDLLHGNIHNVYGGSYNEGITARTVVNVPSASTIQVDSIFGGAYGTQILPPCDVYESNVNYNNTDETATVRGAIFGGNNNERRTLYAHVNISSPVWSNKDKGYLAKVYGAGRGIDTWSEYTEVNLNSGAKVYEVYGGGEMGHVLNAESVQQYMQLYENKPSPQISAQDPYWRNPALWNGGVGTGTLKTGKLVETDKLTIPEKWSHAWADAWTLGDYYSPDVDSNGDGETDSYDYTGYANNRNTNLTNDDLVTNPAIMDDRDYTGYSTAEKAKRQFKYNTNVRIKEGATVVNYAYGGGYGTADVERSGDVYGTTYIALLGGTVNKDIYAAGTAGAVNDLFGMGHYSSSNPTGFTASANAYIYGGSCRNVYGGGWLGNVGHHNGAINASTTGDIDGETHVVIGDMAGTGFKAGIPTVQRNAYGGGEGGAVFGTAYLKLNNGYIGYQYNPDGSDKAETTDIDERYEEKIEDDTKDTPNTLLTDAGCLFGGGYIDNSSVDKTKVYIYGGHVRNSAFGGGEVAAIGRGDMKEKGGGGDYELNDIYRAGKTNIEMYEGHVHRNVFGGGRGYDNLGGHGKLHCDGYIFGQTEVHIHGGEIGTVSGVADGDGNVFGGCDIGYVYSAYEKNGVTYQGKKDGVRYDPLYQGYYYQYEDDNYVTVQVPNGTYTAAEATAYNTAHASEPGHVDVLEGDTKYSTERQFTEDCKVLIEPHLKVTTPVTIDGHSYGVGQFVPIDTLNYLQNKTTDASKWECLDQTGIIIHNAVFAGGNTQSGMTTSANAASVFGNATASINDIYHRDMITLGTRHTGGLYGDGNLTLVDGYRELNITNYGTDYYNIDKEIGIDTYHALPDREADYYELRYTCLKDCKDKDDTQYRKVVKDESGNVVSKASTITADEMQTLFVVKTYENGKVTSETSVKDGGDDILKYDSIRGEWVPSDAGYWEESGVLPVYAGRLMNSIQRADFCGVYGSRMVMQGAQDRVVDEVDYTNYTINRVREVSLNKKRSVIAADASTADSIHGNYFGIYNTVNYLGALTSDVKMSDIRKTENTDSDYRKTANGKDYGEASYYDWKEQFTGKKERNNGSSHNKVALASGVYLEITTEESTGDGLYEKVWGPITGVIELDLINVTTGLGGGYVYAKNQHGEPTKTNLVNTTLTSLNRGAATQWDYNYAATDANRHEWQTSGNFVHSTQRIIDDCYNISNRYLDATGAMPAHYWYIKGSVYVYDQYISAYTGSANAYSEVVNIPLTIAAASHGRMKLLNVQPNLYAFYSSPGVEMGEGKRIVINDKTYYKNDTISYWDWYLLSKTEKELFVPETYVVTADCTYGTGEGAKTYTAGTVLLPGALDGSQPGTYNYLKKYAPTKQFEEGVDAPLVRYVHNIAKDEDVAFDFVFRSSNNVSHNTGYILTYEVNNPSIWDNWYTPKTASYTGKKTLAEYEKLISKTPGEKDNYNNGPTYRLKAASGGELLGQTFYEEGNLISKTEYDTYQTAKSKLVTANGNDNALADSASFEVAWIVTNKLTITDGTGHEEHYNPGVAVSNTFKGAHTDGTYDEAYICTSSIQLTKENVIYRGSTMTEADKDAYITDVNGKMDGLYTDASSKTTEQIKALDTDATFTAENKKQLTELAQLRDELNANIVRAYYSKKGGMYGGNYYKAGENYRGLEAWSSMSETDREKFQFNYDALDLLIDTLYREYDPYTEGHKYLYDGNYTSEEQVKADGTGNKAGYSIEQKVDYTASYSGSSTPTVTNNIWVKHSNGTIEQTTTLHNGDEVSRRTFEDSLINEKRHYSPIAVTQNDTFYVVHTAFQMGYTPYAVGEVVSPEVGRAHSSYVTKLYLEVDNESPTYYYCRETFTPVTTGIVSQAVYGATSVTAGQKGTIIKKAQYNALKNEQDDFTIHGVSPTETSTFYVSRESDIYDLTRGKIITVIYQYDYDEADENGNVTPISERHVLNIHLSFKSGVPTIEDITPPDIILPGDKTSLREPVVTPGAYEITGYGWQLFETPKDAESHTNGIEYNPTFDPLYWYQDGHYVAYYAKSYLGRTYSNAVPVSVANYHDLADVMSETNKKHHMYIDHANVKRDSKIYIKDYTGANDGLDYLKELYDLSLLHTDDPADAKKVTTDGDGLINSGSAFIGHKPLSKRVKAGDHLEFFLQTDIDHTDDWTSIGTGDDPCFQGTFHGDGHTIKGLTSSLFDKLCGDVYNLGVMGSFTSAGVAEQGSGYVENSWISTSSTEAKTSKPVFAMPSRTSEQITEKGPIQLVNSYYLEEADATNKYTNHANDATYGLPPVRKPAHSFYNGEVAYDLNSSYLNKRYYNSLGLSSGNTYPFLPANADGTLPETLSWGFYPTDAQAKYGDLDYVMNRFADGDYRYAGGFIPDEEDMRARPGKVEKNGKEVDTTYYAPIWPDDYIFFGQKLTYGYSSHPHQDVPTAILRDGGRLSQTDDANRVYRAPAYFRSKEMSVAYFNPKAYLALKSADGTRSIYDKMMTAIDFAGHNDTHNESDKSRKPYELGLNNTTQYFYAPLLDDGGLTGIQNCDLTQNLLVYAPAASGEGEEVNKATHDVLTAYFKDPKFDDHYDNADPYRRVSIPEEVFVNGHLVQSDRTATNDHFLVDKQDFNAPFAYTFDNSHRMWYQRKPESTEFVDLKNGWQGISIPFTAELVTTQDKGEITHFFTGSTTGHEYWLRQFDDITEETTPSTVAKASFGNLAVGTEDKNYTNTFLWDYYYKNAEVHDQKDKNNDTYLEYRQYYKESHKYVNYPLLTKATPYLIGFPGATYYEFDLSGNFEAKNTAADNSAELSIDKLARQTITFASETGIEIGVSDDEMAGVNQTLEGAADKTNKNYSFTYKPSYMNEELADGDYVMNSEGNAYVKLDATGSGKWNTTGQKYANAAAFTAGQTAADDGKLYKDADGTEEATSEYYAEHTGDTYYTRVSEVTVNDNNHVKPSLGAFRPYFRANAVAKPAKRWVPDTIIFSGSNGDEFNEGPESALNGSIEIYSRGRSIFTRSHMKEAVVIRIVNVAGLTLANYVLEPEQTIETPVYAHGTYIVNKKKLFVR